MVLSSRMSADRVAGRVESVERMINKEFGLDISVLVRSQAELARVVRRDPLALLRRLRHESAPGPQRGEKRRRTLNGSGSAFGEPWRRLRYRTEHRLA